MNEWVIYFVMISMFIVTCLYLTGKLDKLTQENIELSRMLKEEKKGYRVNNFGWELECSRLHHELITLRKQCSNYENILKDCLDTTNNFLHVLPRWGTIIDVIIIEDAKTLVFKLESLLNISSEE